MTKPSDIRKKKNIKKLCLDCLGFFHLHELKKAKTATYGRQRLCLACDRKRGHIKYAKNPNKICSQTEKYRKSEKGRKMTYQMLKRQREKYPEKFKARHAVNYAVKTGKLLKPKTCQDCSKESRIEGHHDDYTRPLDVLWLCPRCHKAKHGFLIEQKVEMPSPYQLSKKKEIG